MWKGVQAAPADAIFGLTEAFKNDPNTRKVNLGVGVYQDDDGNTPILKCVKEAERLLLDNERTKSYLPISGDPIYAACVQQLLFGADAEVIASKRAATAHAPGGTGALRVGAQLLYKFRPQAKVWVSSPTWANHVGIFADTGFELRDYAYYNGETHGLDSEAMFRCLEAIPSGDIVLLHACCHNPSGVDPQEEQWQRLVDIARKKQWLPFLDFAYQGFGEGVEKDRQAVEMMAAAGVDFIVASSFSKNFGLYNERTGAITIVSPTAAEAGVAMSHLKKTVRGLYSNPPAHGGLTVATILNNQELRSVWMEELDDMSSRIVAMRNALVDGLAARRVAGDFSYIKQQRGMFSFSGLDDGTVSWLRDNKGIYVVGGGRINLAGLTTKNIDYVCDSISEALAGK